MRRFVAHPTDTTSTLLGKCFGGNVVVELATLKLRAISIARSILAWLTGGIPAGVQVVETDRMQPAAAGTARARRHYCPSAVSSRPVTPGPGAWLDRS